MPFTTRDVEYLEREIFVFYSRFAKERDLDEIQWFTVHLKGVHLKKTLMIENHLPSMDGSYKKLLNAEISGRDWLEVFSKVYMIIAKEKQWPTVKEKN